MGQRVDEPLNDTGIKQAEELSEGLSGESFGVIFSSPLKRAKETAEIINKDSGITIRIDDRITERDFGSLSGKNWDKIKSEAYWTVHDDDRAQKYDYSSFGGETAKEVKERLLSFLDDLKKEHKNKKVLIVAHGGIMKILQLIYGEGQEIFTPENAKLYCFDI